MSPPIIESVEPDRVIISLPPEGPFTLYRLEEGGTWQEIARDVNDEYEDTDVMPGQVLSYATSTDDDLERSEPVEVVVPEEPTEADLEALGLDEIDLNDPEQRELALAILRGDVGPEIAQEMTDEADNLDDPEASADDWFLTAAEILGIGVILAGIVGAGGLNNFDEDAQKSTEDQLVNQLDYLDGAADQLAGGVFGKKDQEVDTLGSRMDQYGNALGTVAEGVRNDEAVAGAAKWARRVLSTDPTVQHCFECLDLANESWMPVEDMDPIGTCTCLSNCLCTIEYSSAEQMPEGDDEQDAEPMMSTKLLSHGADPEFVARLAE